MPSLLITEQPNGRYYHIAYIWQVNYGFLVNSSISEAEALDAVSNLVSPNLFKDLLPDKPLPLDDVMGLAINAGLLSEEPPMPIDPRK